MIDVAGNLRRVMERAAQAARSAGREPESIQLVAVAKTKPAELVRAAIEAGARIIGENYIQEAKEKIPAAGKGVAWHLIGHLQRNKARDAVELFDVIQTLDSERLAKTLDHLGQERGLPIRTLIEVNVAGEASKAGVSPRDLPSLIASLAPLEWVLVEGLMTVPPFPENPEAARPFFRQVRELRDRLRPDTPPNVSLDELSMGMTDDFPIAIQEGATLIRVGRAIFGERG